jgi:hypothetical protein
MHNWKNTIHHFHFDDMETLQHILWYRSNAIINNKNTEKHAGNIFINDPVRWYKCHRYYDVVSVSVWTNYTTNIQSFPV